MRIVLLWLSLIMAGIGSAAAAGNPPAAPSHLWAWIRAGRVSLSWSDNSDNETRFVLMRQIGTDLFSRIAVLGPNVTRYEDTDLNPWTTYTYIVRAINDAGVSKWSAACEVMTVGNPPVSRLDLQPGLAVPANLKATAVAPTRIDLTWQDTGNDEVGFSIMRRTSNGVYELAGGAARNATRYTDTTVHPGTTYTYIMRAISQASQSSEYRGSAWSNESSAVTPSGPPPAPTHLTTTPTASSHIRLAWKDRSDNETGFALLRRLEPGLYARIAVVGPNTTSYTDKSVSPKTTYRYILRAINDSGGSDWSNESRARVPDGPPAAPGTLFVSDLAEHHVSLKWQDRSNNETGFVLLRKIGSGLYSRIAVLGPDATTYTDATVGPNTAYTYIMRAINDEGASAWSNERRVTTPPAAPTDLVATVAGTLQVQLSWTDNSEDETSFSIWRKSGADDWTFIYAVEANRSTFTDWTADPMTIYVYRVRAERWGKATEWSNEAQVTTPDVPLQPMGFHAGAISSTAIGLRWEDRTNNETGFEIWRFKTPGGWWEDATRIGIAPANSTTFLDQDVELGYKYYYRMRAFNQNGPSEWTHWYVTTPLSGLFIRHSAPTIATESGPTRITVEWNVPGDYEVSLGGITLRVTDASGRLITGQPLLINSTERTGSRYVELNTSDYPPGQYLVNAVLQCYHPGDRPHTAMSAWSTLTIPPPVPAHLQ